MVAIVFNKNNIVNDGNNTFVYNFPSTVSFPNHEIAVQSINMFYSWNNINVNSSNNTFKIYFPANINGAASSAFSQLNEYTVTISAGHYEVADLNVLLQNFCLTNGLYLVNQNGENVFFMEFIVNPTSYAIQINITTFPQVHYFGSSTGSGANTIWTGTIAPFIGWKSPPLLNGVGIFNGFPDYQSGPPLNFITYTPYVYLPSKFCFLLGYLPDTYTYGGANGTVSNTPPTVFDSFSNYDFSIVFSFTGTLSPQVQPNSSIYFSLSNIQNNYAIPSSIIYSIAPTAIYGGQITNYPPQFAFNKLISGSYTQLRLTILGLNYQPITINDPNITITLVIRDIKNF
jgi:hypothetical protein